MLYSANVMDVAKPIEKKGAKKKSKKQEEVTPEPVVEVKEEEVKKEKKPLTEKQLAALENRKRKREEAKAEKEAAKKAEEEAIAAKEAEIKAKEEEILQKKAAMKEKRRLAKEQRFKELTEKAQQEVSPPASGASSDGLSEALDTEIKKIARKPKKARDESEPPAWFQKYVAGVKQEEAKQGQQRIPKRQVEEQARTVAQEQWRDGLTRDRVQNEVDSHMSRMYGMIFNNRRFK